MYGTDNRLTASDVVQRWNTIEINAEKYGIAILGFSSDGDTRLLKAMRHNVALCPLDLNMKSYKWNWF